MRTTTQDADKALRARSKAEEELSQASAGLRLWISTRAAAMLLGVHPDTLSDWRNANPAKGPPWRKGASSEGGKNRRVKYDYQGLVNWARDHSGRSEMELRLVDEVERVMHQARLNDLKSAIAERRREIKKRSKQRRRAHGPDAWPDTTDGN